MKQFYEQIPAEWLTLSDREAVDRYADGASLPGAAIEGLTPEQLRSCPVPGTWSIQRIVTHLMDSDLVAAYRMKRTIAEETPRLDAYDETAFAERLPDDKLDAASVCEVFRMNRVLTAELLRNLPEDAFARVARHPLINELTLSMLIHVYAYHVHHHVKFIETKKRMILDKSVSAGASA